VTSRVILRIRREQVSQVATATIRNQVSAGSKNVDIANLVGPTKKSVHVIKNRLALIVQSFQDSVINIKTEWRQKRKTRAELKKQKHSNKINKKKNIITKMSNSSAPSDKTELTELSTNQIIQPKTPILRNTFSSIGPKAKNSLLFSTHKIKKAGAIITKASSSLKDKLPKKKNEAEVVEENESFPTAKPKLRLVEKDNTESKTTNASIDIKTDNKEVSSINEAPVTQKGLRKIFNKETNKTPLDKAQQELNAANYQNVENILVPYLMKNPRNADAYMLLGKAALGRHAWDEATEIFEQAVAIDSTTKGCYAAFGYASYRSGKLTQALEALQKAHDAEPNNVVIIRRLLTIAQRMDNLPMQRSLEEKLNDLQANQDE
jgi:tetratricopeptide (TPR) repeat protein